jgi:hypothetical protein
MPPLAPVPEPSILERIRRWIDFRDYVQKRRAIFKSPGPATSVQAIYDWTSMSQFLVQGMLLPSLLLLIIIPALPNYAPLHATGWNRSVQIKQMISLVKGQDPSYMKPQVDSDWARYGSGLPQGLQEILDRELGFRRWAIRTLIMAVLVVPVSIVVATFVFPYRFPPTATGPMSDPLRVRAALVYVLGSHLFWLNAANAAVAALLYGLMDAVPSYFVILLVEVAYLLLVILILGTLTDHASVGLRIALQMKIPSKKQRFLVGDSLKSDLVTLHFATGLALTGVIRLVW